MLDIHLGSNHNSPIYRSASKLTLEAQKNLAPEKSMYKAALSVPNMRRLLRTQSYTAMAKLVWKTQVIS